MYACEDFDYIRSRLADIEGRTVPAPAPRQSFRQSADSTYVSPVGRLTAHEQIQRALEHLGQGI